MKNKAIVLVGGILVSTLAMAKNDGSDIPACKGVTEVCMKANVSGTDSRNGKAEKGYVAGEHKFDGKGLWADCVAPLAKGKVVAGVSGVSQDAAKACLEAEHATHTKKKN